MLLEWAAQGIWLPVLASRLLGPLKMTGKQTGWIYATLPLAAIFIPLIMGPVADQWIDPKWILAGGHFVCAVLILVAAKQRTFGRLFAVMLAWSIFYAPSMALVNTVLFRENPDDATQGLVFMWAPIGWALVGYFLTGWRWKFKTEGEGTDALYMSAVLSVAMGVFCCLLPSHPLPGATFPIGEVMAKFTETNFLLFMLVSLAVAGSIQFYFLSTGQFMQDIGISGKNVSASMGMAQAVQTLATFFLMSLMMEYLGYKGTLLIGIGSWTLMYVIYMIGKPFWAILGSQGLHGIAYVLFMIVGQIYVDAVSPPNIRSTMQSVLFALTTGLGPFVCTYLAGSVMDHYSKGGKFQWRKIWAVPAAITFAGLLAMTLFHNPPEKLADPPAAVEKAEAATTP
jgi:MFS family permease